MRHRRRCRQRAEAALAGVEEGGERLVERDLAELDPRLVRLEPRDGAHELDDPDAGAAAVEEAQRLLDVRAADRVPAVADADERLLRRGEVGELLVRQLGVADGEPPVESRQLRRGEEAAGADARRARRRQVDPDARRRAEPRRGQQDGHVSLLELRHRLAEEEPDLLRAELRLGRLGGVELDPDLRQHGLELRQLADQIAARIAGAQEREDVAVAVPEQRRGQAEGRIVARLQPELEHEPRLLARVRGGRSSRWRPRRHSVRASVSSPPSTQSESRFSSAARPEWRGSTESAAVSPSSRWSIAFARPALEGASRTPSARRRSRAIWSTRTG